MSCELVHQLGKQHMFLPIKPKPTVCVTAWGIAFPDEDPVAAESWPDPELKDLSSRTTANGTAGVATKFQPQYIGLSCTRAQAGILFLPTLVRLSRVRRALCQFPISMCLLRCHQLLGSTFNSQPHHGIFECGGASDIFVE